MAIDHVSELMPSGVRALGNLLTMLQIAASGCTTRLKRSPTVEKIGFLLDSPKFWIGIDLRDPGNLLFATCCTIDENSAKRLGIGEVRNEPFFSNCASPHWRRAVTLEPEAEFFTLDKNDQLKSLTELLQDCLTKARSIEAGDDPLPPPEPEGD